MVYTGLKKRRTSRRNRRKAALVDHTDGLSIAMLASLTPDRYKYIYIFILFHPARAEIHGEHTSSERVIYVTLWSCRVERISIVWCKLQSLLQLLHKIRLLKEFSRGY